MVLTNARVGELLHIEKVRGHGTFRRRLLECGLVPGTAISLSSVAPLGDPLELLVRGASLSIRRAEAAGIEVKLVAAERRASSSTRAEALQVVSEIRIPS